jgi:hypothetical protein
MLFQEGSINGTSIIPWQLHPFKVLRMVGVPDSTLGDKEPILQHDSKLFHNDKNNKIGGGTSTAGNNNKTPKRIRLSIPSKEDTKESDNNAPPPFFLPRTKQDIYNDAYLSFEFALRHGIYAGVANGLSNTTSQVLDDWIHLLQSTLPPMWKIQDMITDLIEHKEEIVQGEEKLMAILDKHPPPKKAFSVSCTRGDKYAGYTCGLWELFHIMTIGLVEWNHLAMGDDWAYYIPDEAATTLRDYIQNFFGCEKCRVNFLHEYDSCALDRCNRLAEDATGGVEDWKELSLWLFEMHNAVNTRLLRERMDREEKRSPTDQEILDVQWPSRWDCPTCWHADGRWDQDQIYMFLRLTYWYVRLGPLDMELQKVQMARRPCIF